MTKRISYMQYDCLEVAPAPLISPIKPSSAPRLGTISEDYVIEGSPQMFTIVLQRRSFVLLPILLSFVSYFFMERYTDII